VFDGPPQLIAPAGEEEQPRASQLALGTTHQPVPVEAVAAIPDQAVWTMTAASAPPAGAAPSSAEHTARDLIPYLRLAGQVAGAGAATLAVILLLLVVAYRWVDPPTSTLILGQRLAGTEIDQTWVPLERISPNLVRAVILSEDGGFCRHRGVDWAALGEAIESDRGGSTITMQVVKNLFLWPSRSYVRKAMEMALAYLVEIVWPKHRVLELYLNIAEWGPGIFGAEAAAQYHFGKPAARLTAQEAALLAVALPNPLEREAWHPGYLHKRLADNLLTRMRAVRTAMRCVQPPRSGG
jgi:monofunctional biosynthetic peptidoglycan transglycosylase